MRTFFTICSHAFTPAKYNYACINCIWRVFCSTKKGGKLSYKKRASWLLFASLMNIPHYVLHVPTPDKYISCKHDCTCRLLLQKNPCFQLKTGIFYYCLDNLLEISYIYSSIPFDICNAS